MSVKNDCYMVGPQPQWYSVDLDKVTDKEKNKVASKCLSDARFERLKAASFIVLTGAAALGNRLVELTAALGALILASYFAPVLAFPVAFSETLYEMVETAVVLSMGLGLFGLFLGYTNSLSSDTPSYAAGFYADAQEHWDYATHLYEQQQLVLNKA